MTGADTVSGSCTFGDRVSWIAVRDGLQRHGGATGLEPLPDAGDAGLDQGEKPQA